MCCVRNNKQLALAATVRGKVIKKVWQLRKVVASK